MSSSRYLNTFSNSYVKARDRFLKAALDVNATFVSHQISPHGSQGEELTIDVVTLGAKDPERTILLTTGLHGIEGYFGSALLLAWLEEFKANPIALDKTAIVLVHALNPYGFSWARRVNENNVDLNRNFILSNQKFTGASPELNKIPWLKNPVSPDNASFNITIATIATILQHGFNTLRNALLQGQYEYPDALFFGGRKYEATSHILETHIDAWTRHAPNIMHLDFHTGIGKSGTCHLLTFAPMNDKQTVLLQSQFGKDVTPLGVGLLKGGKPDGVMVDWIAHHFAAKNKNYAHLVVEFGTYPAVRTFKALYQENRYFAHPGSKRDTARKDLMEIFCPSDAVWRKKAVAEGIAIISKALKFSII